MIKNPENMIKLVNSNENNLSNFKSNYSISISTNALYYYNVY